jgi:cytoskeleton protein RodZ
MNEPRLDAAPAPPAAVTAGGLIRAARERQGLHIAALAASIKVSPKKLEALEADRWAELPDSTFTRALAQTVCRALKIDPKMVLDKLPAIGGVSLSVPMPSDGHAGSEGGGGGGLRSRRPDTSSRAAVGGVPPMVWGAALLLVAAAVLLFLPAGWWGEASVAPTGPLPAASAVAVLPPPEPASAVAAEPLVAAASASMLAPEPSASAAAEAAPLPVLPVAPAAAVAAPLAAAATPAPAPASAVAPSGAGPLQLTASADSWIEIRDARGELIASRLLRAGESLGLDGAVPLRATIGNASGTQVSWRGKAVDLQARAQGNVARLELP